jgi:hypothetical protein
MDSQISARQRLSKHVTTQITIGETMMEYINTWLHSNIKSNDEKLLNYTNEACINNYVLLFQVRFQTTASREQIAVK